MSQPSRVDFSSLVAGFSATALMALEEAERALDGKPPPPGDAADGPPRLSEALDTARHLIDTLGMLEEKTRGNLTADEQRLLQVTLTDLRVRYVKASDRARTSAGA
jgi:hypothetical protein